jgi:hypothetical protein
MLKLDSELLFVGDAGETEPNRASRRSGIEWNNRWTVRPWLLLDLDVAASRARFTEDDPAGAMCRAPSIPWSRSAPACNDRGPWFGHCRCATSDRVRWSRTTRSARPRPRWHRCASATA